MTRIERKAVICAALLGAAIALVNMTGCTTLGQQPPEAQLALACQNVGKAYIVAAGYRAQGKLSAGAISVITSIEAPVKVLCDPKSPPLDLPTALGKLQAYLDQLALVNAGVK